MNLIVRDSFDLEYAKEDNVAIDIGVLAPDNGHFHPFEFITKREAGQALDIIKETKKSEFVDDNESKNEVIYQDDVKELTKSEVISLNDTTLVLENNDRTEKINLDDIVAIEEYGVFEIEGKTIENNQVVLLTTTPDFENAIKSIDTVGNGEMQLSEFKPAEGVKYKIYDNGEKADTYSEDSEIENIRF